MSKFSSHRPPVRGFVVTSADATHTFEGGMAYRRSRESDLFVLAITNMVGEDTFYETASDRDARYRALIHAVTQGNPTFIAGSPTRRGLGRYLRDEMKMRTASLVLAAEYVAADGANGRQLVNAVCQRPDEPAELLAYWINTHGRRIPMAIKRGVADAAVRLYSQDAALKYDSANHSMRMGDVIELVHPAPLTHEQADLFRYLLDVGHKRENPRVSTHLDVLRTERMLRAMPEDERRAYARKFANTLADAGYTWERLSQWLPGGMDAEAWQFAIPNMRPMALIRNLRNFDQAGISNLYVDLVINRITDPVQVPRARLFPYQVWSAYKNAPSDNWKRALGLTLDLTTDTIPQNLDGTLVLIDTSGSMSGGLSERGTITRAEVAAVMGAATAHARPNCDIVIYANDSRNVTSQVLGRSVLGAVDLINHSIGSVGHATYGHTAIAKHWNPKKHKRVIIFTDDQQHDSGRVAIDHVPTIFTFNLAGYAPSSLKSGIDGRYTIGGFSDSTFSAIPVLESGRSSDWPF